MGLPFKTLIIFLSVILPITRVLGQTLPAGVGQDNIIWLEANDLTGPLADGFTWLDKTVNSFDAIEINDGSNTPTLVTIAGQQYLRFAGAAGEQLIIPDDNATTNLLDNSSEFSVITVFNTGATDTRAVISKRLNPGNRSWTLFYNTGFEMYGYAGGTTVGGSGSVAAAGNPYITTMTVDAALSGASVKLFVNTDAEGSTGSNVSIPDRAEDVYIGLFNNGDTRYFNGDIAEIIVYRDALNGGERLILENYLSQKYSIGISNDFFGNDPDFNSTYTSDIRGIGTSNGSEKQSNSGFSSGLAINEQAGSLNAVNEFLIFGHNNAVSHVDNSITNLGEPEIINRWEKDYYVELNQNGTVDAASVNSEFIFDFSEAGLPFSGSATDYVLLFRDSVTGDFSRVFANDYAIQNGDQVVVSVPSSRIRTGYYTLGRGTQLISRTWYLLQNGNWVDPSTWTLDAGVLPVPNNPLNEIPGSEDIVIVRSGKTLTIQATTNNLQLGSIVVDGIMDVGTSNGHNFNIIDGTGKIIIRGNGGISNFPGGSTTSANGFADEANGGLLVVQGTGLEFDQNLNLKDLRLELGNATDIVSTGADLSLSGNLTVRFGTLQFGDGTASNRTLSVLGDVTIENNGSTQDGRITTAVANTRHEFNIFGDFINEGSVSFTQRVAPDYVNEATDGIVDLNLLNDSENQLISVQGPTNFYRIEINKGTDATYIADLQANDPANFNLLGPANDNLDNDIVSTDILNANANALGLISGTLKIGVNVDIPVLNRNGNYCIGSNGRLWVDGGTVTKNVATAIVPYGTLEVSAGTLIATGNSGITVRINGLLKVSGGTVLTNNFRTSVQGTQSLGGFQQSGGNVLIDGTLGAGSASGQYYVMSLTYSGNVFIMSGGTLRVREPNGFGAIFINSDPGNISITGGNVIMETSNTNVFRVTSRAPFYNVNMRSDATGNGSIRLEGGTSGAGGNAVTLTGQPLRIINDLVIEGFNDTDFTQFNNPIGNFAATLEAVTSSANRNDVIVGGSFYIGANSTYIGRVGTDYNWTVFDQTIGTDSIETFHWGRDASFALDLGNMRLDRTSGNQLRMNSTGATNGNIRFRIRGDLEVLSGTLDQAALTVQSFGNVKNFDRLGTWFTSGSYPVAGGTPEGAQVRMLPGGGETIEIEDGAIFGNVQINSGVTSDIVFDGDVFIERFDFQEGIIYIGTNNLTIDDLHSIGRNNMNNTDAAASTEMFIESPATSAFLRVVDSGRYDNGADAQRAMIITDGNASDGGLSLKVERNTGPVFGNFQDNYDNKNQLTFPLAFTTSSGSPDFVGAGINTYYRPAQVKISNYSDDGYITIRPVRGELQTTDLSAGELLQHYWRVTNSEFSSAPTVSYRFYYRNRFESGIADLVAGATNETTYVPGKTQDGGAYTRSYESDGNAEEDNDGISNGPVDPDTRAIIFNGDNVGSVDDDLFGFSANAPGITLENANYTTGVSTRFVGSPRIFYVRQNGNWTNNNTWSFTRGGPSAGDFPQAGDIAVMRRLSASYSGIVTITSAVEAAVVEFDDENGFSSGCPRIIFATNSGFASYNSDFGEVRIAPTHQGGAIPFISHGAVIQYRLNQTYTGVFPSGDFGGFNQYENALVIYGWQGAAGNADVTLSSTATEYPILWFEGGNLNRKIRFPDTDVRINGKITVPGDCIVLPNGDSDNTLTIEQDLEVGHPSCCGLEGRFLFPGDAPNVATVIVKNDIRVRGSDTNSRLGIDNASGGTSIHRLIVNGNITIQSTGGDINLGDGDPLKSNVELEIQGESDNSFDIEDVSGSTADFYRIILNKGDNSSNTFSFNDPFTLPSIGLSGVQPIEILNGTLDLNAPVDITLTDATTGDFLLPNLNNLEATSGSGALRLQQGILRIEGDDTGLVIDGLLEISGGTFDMASGTGNGNNFIEYSSTGNAEIEVNSGSLEVGSQIRRGLTAITGLLSFTQTGGTVRVGINAAPESTRGVFELLNSGSQFTHTGGDFTIVRQNGSSTVASLIIQPDISNVNVSGSTITIGDASTPANQNSIGINASVPLNNLLITGNAGLTARTYVNDLELNNLSIQNNGNFSANGFNLTVLGNLDNDGDFSTNGSPSNNQTTFFSATATQAISGTGTTEFWNLNKTGSGILNVNKDIIIENELNLLTGILNSGGNAIDIKGDVINDAVMQSDFAGPGLIFSGTELQNLGRTGIGTSTFGTITIDNQNGVDIPLTGRDFRIDNKVILANGRFNIGANLLYMENDAFFENGAGGTNRADFNGSNMVTVNTSIVDKGIRKTFSDGFNSTYLFPVGLSFYTPVEVEVDNITSAGPNTGNITVKPINGVTAGIVEDNDETCSDVATTDFVDQDNVLQYYWLIKSQNITDFDGSISLFHTDDFESIGAIAAPDYSLINYAPARLLENTNTWDKSYSEVLFDEVANRIDFKVNPTTNFTNLSSADIEGRYTAGITRDNADNPICGGAIPDVVPLYITVPNAASGDIVDLASFSVAPGGTAPSLGESPDLIINGDFTLNLTDEFWRFRRVEIQSGATLSVIGAGVNLGTVVGDGTIKLVDNSNFPAGDYDGFFPDPSCSGGGGVEYEINSGSQIVLSGINNVRQVILSGNGEKIMGLGQQTNICENLEIRDNGIFRLDDNIRMSIKGDVIKESTASFDGDYPSALIFLDGSARQSIDGSFIGLEAFSNLNIFNSGDITIINAVDDDIEISNTMFLGLGRVLTDADNSLTILNGSNIFGAFDDQTHIDGPLKRELQSSTSSFAFPVGDNGEYLPVDVDEPSYSAGGPIKIWTSQYLATNPTSSPLIANVNDSLNFSTYNGESGNSNSVLSGRHMWVVDVNSPASSQVRITWNDRTNVGGSVPDWQLLRVMSWDAVDEEWESYGNGNSVADYLGYSFSNGAIISDRLLSYSTRFIGLASINTPLAAPNALPVELLQFSGEANDEFNLLKWATANERNSAYFIIERSEDLENFEEIGFVDAAGESMNLTNYEFIDDEFINSTNYYRLKIVDIDGYFEYSNVIQLVNESSDDLSGIQLKLYPNPTSSGAINYSLEGMDRLKAYNFRIIDLMGQEILQSKTVSELNGKIELPKMLNSGVYIFSIQIGGQVVQKRFVVLN